jgi:hypothetical protein
VAPCNARHRLGVGRFFVVGVLPGSPKNTASCLGHVHGDESSLHISILYQSEKWAVILCMVHWQAIHPDSEAGPRA